jgi:hypothetical protein
LAEQADRIAAETDVSGINTFQAQRRVVRQALDSAGVSKKIDELVVALIAPQVEAVTGVAVTAGTA